MKIKGSEKIEILGPCQSTKKAVEREGGDDTSCSWCAWNGPQRIGEKAVGTGNQRKNQDHPDHKIID